MDWSTVAYNLSMFVVDGAALWALGRRRSGFAWLAATAGAAGVATLLAVGLGGGTFGAFRLAAYGVFMHGTVGMLGTARIFWPTRRRMALMAGLIAGALVAVGVDAFWVEPTWLEVTRLRIASGRIGEPVRIVVLADLQTDRFGAYERGVLRQVLQEQPDVILLTGDYFQAAPDARSVLQRQANVFLREVQFSAVRGVFAVRGNCDPRRWQETFEGLPVETPESTRSFDLGDLWLTCLSMRDSLNPSLACRSPSAEKFHLVLGHSPNFALGRIQADLLVAGHTHGGQVRLPEFGPLMTLSKVPRAWAAGLTELPGGGKLLVSRGVGMERGPAPRLRLWCRPQLVVIELVPERASEGSS